MDMLSNLVSDTPPGRSHPAMDAAMMGHADRLWKMLDNLAESDPEAYKNFISEQTRAASVARGSAAPLGRETPVILLQAAKGTSTTPMRLIISLWKDPTGQVPPAACAGQEEIMATTSQWRDVDIRFLPKQPPFDTTRDGAVCQLVELYCHPGVLQLAAAGTPMSLRAVLAEAAVRHVEHMLRAPLDRRCLTLQVARAALQPNELKAAEELMATEAVKKAAQETLKGSAPRSLLSQLSQMAVAQAPADAPPLFPSTQPPGPPRKPLIQEL